MFYRCFRLRFPRIRAPPTERSSGRVARVCGGATALQAVEGTGGNPRRVRLPHSPLFYALVLRDLRFVSRSSTARRITGLSQAATSEPSSSAASRTRCF